MPYALKDDSNYSGEKNECEVENFPQMAHKQIKSTVMNYKMRRNL